MSGFGSRLLADRQFIAVQPDLIRALQGNVASAVVLQHLHYRLTGSDAEIHDGRTWYAVKVQDLADEVGMSKDQVKHILAKLRETGLVLVSQRAGYDRTNVYAIDHEHELLGASVPDAYGESASSKGPIRPIEAANPPNVQYLQTNKTKETVYPADAGNAGDVVANYVDHYTALQSEKPPSRHIGRIAREARLLLDEGRDFELVMMAAMECATAGHANMASAYTWMKAHGTRQASRSNEVKESAASGYLRLAQTLNEARPLELNQ